MLFNAAEHAARELTELGLRTAYFQTCKQLEEAVLLQLLLHGSDNVDTVLAGQEFADMRRQAANLASNIPNSSRK